ncbi:MAG: SAM-dependent methyltransferase [Cyclobacteriaceae bacterium]|nr:SAM-dependent methyltransferase [Cyclobacteriaceae bacterium]
MKKSGTLYIIPSNISQGDGANKALFSPVFLETLQSVRYFLTENVRTSRRFLSGLDLGIDISGLIFHELTKKTNYNALNERMQHLLDGHDMGVLSEAGCPGIADPGALAVAWAHAHEIKVTPLVGPSSIFLALMASGFNGQAFTFNGYLPIEQKARCKAIIRLEKESARTGTTQLFMETPYRNNALWKSLLQTCNPTTRLCVARDITGPNEWIKTQSVRYWKGIEVDLHKIPCIFLLQA